QPIYTDFRLIAATNRDLAGEVAAGRFREDLFYRLNVIPISLPPLRRRKADIPLLVRYFLKRYATRYNRSGLALTAEDEKRLLAYDWPGNIRELKNMVERGVLLAADGQLALHLENKAADLRGDPFADLPTLDELQRRYIRFVLDRTGGKISGPDGAARMLGMKRTSLYHRLKKLNIR
ncbi:MAG: sigma 54-interacting transcriptional regulator, partial [Desulfosudaceae bacterium]